ncbi:MAG: DUF2177 family protein [Rhodospirillales bacterium]|nr:DUF2177 family protein [Rhodospirillales bacterium]
MMKYVVAYLAAATTLFAIDLLWLGVIAKSFYRAQIGSLMLDQINIVAAILFYAVYVVCVVIFAVALALHTGSWRTAIVLGTLFGFFAYATYDMTNLATLRGWPIAMVVVDIAWGTCLTAISATAGFLVAQRLFPPSGAS